MNKQELIDALNAMEGNPIILIAKDEEWNSVHSLGGIETVRAASDMFEWHPVHPDDYDEYEDESLADAVVLWG